jgi:hypothetical protein
LLSFLEVSSEIPHNRPLSLDRLKRSSASADLRTVNKETLDKVSFGLDLVQLAAHLGSSQPSGAIDVPAEVEQAEVEQLKVVLRQIAVGKQASEPQE